MRKAIYEILKEEEIDPDMMVGKQTAYEKLEAAIIGALEEIDDEEEENEGE